jgi:acetate kinase
MQQVGPDEICDSEGNVLDGIDALVFTAGIGENSPEVRAATCANFAFLGLKLDDAKNIPYSVDQDISLPDSTVRVLVIRAQEDWAIARECWRLASARVRGGASAS